MAWACTGTRLHYPLNMAGRLFPLPPLRTMDGSWSMVLGGAGGPTAVDHELAGTNAEPLVTQPDMSPSLTGGRSPEE